MARAKRHYLPGFALHITHDCQERVFLLKFGRDRRGWLPWLFETCLQILASTRSFKQELWFFSEGAQRDPRDHQLQSEYVPGGME